MRRGGHFDSRFVSALLDPRAGATTAGPIRWEAEGSNRIGTITVLAPSVLEDDGRLVLRVSRMRPERPKLVYLADGRWVRRLCVNTAHRPLTGTHKHRIEREGTEECYEPDDIPLLPTSPDVPVGIYREVLQAFANECGIQFGDDFEWTDPWEVAR